MFKNIPLEIRVYFLWYNAYMKRRSVTIILPCLNESRTVLKCCKEIKTTLDKSEYKNDYKILVVDNGSTDESVAIYEKNSIEYVVEKKRGYGNALRRGIEETDSEYIVMLDADLSYDNETIVEIIKELEGGSDLVVGNRFKGGVQKQAMPIIHKIGSRFLTFYANLFFRTKVHDFHCGIRGFRRKRILECGLKSGGFEFASEMILKAKINKLKMKEIPTKLFKDGRNKKSHLRTFRDGFRHLHEIHKCKFVASKIFRYGATFLGLVFLFSMFTLGSCLIPHEWVAENAIKSIQEFNTELKNKEKTLPFGSLAYEKFEVFGDIRNYAMIFQTDEKEPIKSAIEMNYLKRCDARTTECDNTLRRKVGETVDYSRYWQGQSVAIHYVTPFLTFKNLIIIVDILFIVLFLFTLVKIFKEDKMLAAGFLVAIFAINMPFMLKSLEFLPVMFIMLIVILWVLKSRKKEGKNLDLIFIVSGVLTCYFDFLTCETITLTMPLIIYVYLEQKDGRKVKIKKIISVALLWLLGYAGMFIAKWSINILHYGAEYIVKNLDYIFERPVGGGGRNILKVILVNFKPILPLGLNNNSEIFNFGIFLVALVYNVFLYRKYLVFYLICLVPILRFIVVYQHSAALYYFTYRATICIVLVTILSIFMMVKKALKNN